MIRTLDKYIAAVEISTGPKAVRYLLKEDGSYSEYENKSHVAVFNSYEEAREASHRLRDRFPEGARPFVKAYKNL